MDIFFDGIQYKQIKYGWQTKGAADWGGATGVESSVNLMAVLSGTNLQRLH
jgi:hypothetical protein